MSLGLALSNAVSAMKLNQESLGVLSNNIANVNTAGYSRQIIDQEAVNIEGVGGGVRIEDITRKVDTYLQASTISQTSQTQSLSTINDYYQDVQNLLGTPGAQNSIDEYMTSFFNSLQSYADQPELTSSRSNLVNSANTLATQVSGLASNLESLRLQADGDISTTVGDVNTALKTLYSLNGQIARASALKQSTAGLLDQRDTALKTVAGDLDVNITYNPDGTVAVTAGDGGALVDGNLHQLTYQRVPSQDSLINNQPVGALQVVTYDASGTQTGTPYTLITGGTSGNVKSSLTGGSIAGLQNMRDNLLPQILNQLDMLASNLRNSMNSLQNNGVGYPPAQSLTGDRAVTAGQTLNMSGQVRIAALNADGSPITSPYADEPNGIPPLTLDLSSLKSSDTPGTFTVQSLVDEINNYYGAPQNKVELGNVNNIQLASNTDHLPNSTGTFDFDLDLDNISADPASVFVSNVSVSDDQGNTIPNALTKDVPSISLASTNTYTTYNSFNYVDVQLSSTNGLKAGDTIYLGPSSVTPDINGIPPSDVTGYFTIQSVSGNSIRIQTADAATADGSVSDSSGVVAKTAYATSAAGTQARTSDDGEMELNLGSNLTSTYYTVSMDVGVMGADGVVHTSTVSYRVPNGQNNTMNDRYSATGATGDGSIVIPTTSQAALRATLVDANGNEIPKVDGQYVNEPAYLKISGGTTNYSVAIDQLDSTELGNGSQGVSGTGWGLSQYFGLNDFFTANGATATGETLKNSALNLSVEQRIQDNPNLVSSGTLQQQAQPSDLTKPNYSYSVYAGDNTAAQAMAGLADLNVSFNAAGGLPATSTTLQSYSAQLLGYVSSLSSGASDNYTNAQSLLDGFTSRAQAVSGVNLDEELANTIIFQNAYSASAKLVSVVDDMFKTLMDSVSP